MIWKLLFIFFGLASARDVQNVEPEFLDLLIASGQHEKLAELLGVAEHLVRPDNSEQRSEGSKLNQASALGDIVLTEEQERNAINFDRYGGSRWPNGRVPYVISSSYSASEKKIITDAIADFNKRVGRVQLVPRRWDRDYVFVFSGNGCYSSLGKTGGQQALSLQKNGCLSTGTVQHEFIHAIGFTHEQNRSDRDNYVQVLWDNIPTSWHSQYQKVEESNGWKIIGDYDYYSVMHYPIWAPETYKDAFAIPDGIDRNRLGQDDGVTDTDVWKINTLYS